MRGEKTGWDNWGMEQRILEERQHALELLATGQVFRPDRVTL